MKKLRAGGILLWLLASSSVSAEGRYQIEVLAFAQNMPTTELFDQTQSQIQWPNKVLETSVFASVSSENRLLNQVYGALSGTNVSGYQPLLHLSWVQSIAEDSVGDAVHIADAGGRINGFVRLQRGQYLTLITDLEYQPDAHRYYRLHERRRLKLNEAHYFDHPKFGVIAQIRPL